MTDYQVIARKFRPQRFKEVKGQEAIVTTLKNAIRFNRLSQAYLFCGSRGTGKTTLARLLAKAVNCPHLTEDQEPCNQCPSCREITAGSSLDVIEIDGASHRGIEDIRQINETVGYAAAREGYKIYIIDEVHMLTKEAFNALLKTLEEPPPKVKFFFATTEPHKVLPTIISRCQRFNLNRIPLSQIIQKLKEIARQLGIEAEEEALKCLAQRAEGALRDAESLFDQVLAFEGNAITSASVAEILGLMPNEIYFEIDEAGEAGHFGKAFEITHQLFSEGKDFSSFIEGLIDHLRQILIFKISGGQSALLHLTEAEKQRYTKSAAFYSEEQCADLIEYLLEAKHQYHLSPFSKIALESLLLHVMRSHFKLSIETLVRRLTELEQRIDVKEEKKAAIAPPAPLPSGPTKTLPIPAPKAAPPSMKNPAAAPSLFESSISVDPTPTPADLGRRPIHPKPSSPPPSAIPIQEQQERKHPPHHYDTLFYFAAVELDGKLQKN